MTPWIIEGRDPLIFRDGRPLGGNAPIETMRFPFPSTLAGAVRGRLATDPKSGTFTLRGDEAGLEQLLRIPVRGPILAEIDPITETVRDWLLPAPRDALVRDNNEGVPSIIRLCPGGLETGETVAELNAHGLLPIFATSTVPNTKTREDAVLYWRAAAYTEWLRGRVPKLNDRSDLGVAALPRESRMHVSMRHGERIAEDGALFETVGLRFVNLPTATANTPPRLADSQHFALSVQSPGGLVAGKHLSLRREFAPIGGERRIARWWPAPQTCQWLQAPQQLTEDILKDRRARLILVTPAVFSNGSIPGWSGADFPTSQGVRVTVRAACVPSPQVVSGWDLRKCVPKPTRRVVAAGSVYFVELEGSNADIRTWVDATWMQTISDATQDRLDGFGLTTIGTWSK